MNKLKVIISGGGTGGHIFPAISIANAIKEIESNVNILFVGAKGRMEMERVPAAGYHIKGIPARGLKRPLYSPSNISVIIDYIKCKFKAKKILKEFKPNVVVGVGGYASAAVVSAAASLKIPVLLQEQNSFAGLVNRKNGPKADKICVAYPNMERFFPKDRIVFTGNPVRKEIRRCNAQMKAEGLKFYNMQSNKKCVFIVGGSLGCRTLNNCVMKAIENNLLGDYQIIWQCGKAYRREAEKFLKSHHAPNVYCTDFISRMDLAYAAADIVVSRAGASTISELCIAGKCTIFVPSPTVAEDHQTHNAMALVNENAALIVKDAEAEQRLFEQINALLKDSARIAEIESNIVKLAKPNAAADIAKECVKLCKRSVYLIGIGGIGMSAIARYYNSKGFNVSGYDLTPSELTAALQSEGIDVHYQDNIKKIPTDKHNTLVIYTPAIPSDFKELIVVKKRGYTVIKRSRALGHIAKGKFCLAVSGSHGKTTTSTLLSHIYQSSGIGCNAFLGGISKNYHTNLLLSPNNILVAEADEFDRSFHQLFPDIAIVTATDADHLDIYGTAENMRRAYALFAQQVDRDGYLIVKKGTELDTSNGRAKIMSYAYSWDGKNGAEEPDFYATAITPIVVDGKQNGHFTFTLCYKDKTGARATIENCTIGVPGWMNIENGVAAAAAALLGGIEPEKVKEALGSFSGVERRMDIHLNTPERVYIDDYAHHPQEIESALSSIKEAFYGRAVTAIFQPHLYSRTKDFAAEFAKALEIADQVILLNIYPAREKPIEGVTSQLIFDKIATKNKILIEKEELMELLKKRKAEGENPIVVTFGAGNISNLVEPIKSLYTNN